MEPIVSLLRFQKEWWNDRNLSPLNGSLIHNWFNSISHLHLWLKPILKCFSQESTAEWRELVCSFSTEVFNSSLLLSQTCKLLCSKRFLETLSLQRAIWIEAAVIYRYVKAQVGVAVTVVAAVDPADDRRHRRKQDRLAAGRSDRGPVVVASPEAGAGHDRRAQDQCVKVESGCLNFSFSFRETYKKWNEPWLRL